MIKTKKLNFKYEDGPVLRDINLNIKKNSYTAIIGANGSGKTTLAKHFNALLQPTSGWVKVDALDTKNNQEEVRRKVGFVFQNPEDQLVYSIVEEDLAFGLENIGLPTNEIKTKVQQILKELSIERLAKKNVNMLSAGQKQLVALAGVLVMNPEYIIFDEPTTMLDSKNKKNIMETIKKLNQDGIGIILVTNVLDDIKYADNIIVLKKGKKIFNGSKLEKSIIKEAGLDV